MNAEELALLNAVVPGTLEWYNKNSLESGATLSDFLMDLAVKLEGGNQGHDAKKLLQEAVAAGFGE